MFSIKISELVKNGEVIIKTGPFGTQLKASEYVKMGTPVLNVKNLGYGRVVDEKLDMVGNDTVERLSAHLLRTGDIVFGRKGAVERHAFISQNEKGWMQGSDCIRLRVNSSRINPKYLSYYFLTDKHKAFMVGMCSHGTTMASLNQKIIEQIEVPLPSIDVQNKIVALLGCIDEKVKINEKINDNLLEQASSIYQAWFEDFILSDGSCPPSWKQGTLAGIADITSGKRPPVKSAEKTDNAIIPIVGAASVMGYTTEANHTDKILVTGRVGTHGVVQRFNSPCWASDNTLVITSAFYEYTFQILQRIDYRTMNRGSTQPLITQGDMNKVPILIPDNETLLKFETLVGQLMKQYQVNLLENDKLAELRDALLPRLMSGELDVSDLDI